MSGAIAASNARASTPDAVIFPGRTVILWVTAFAGAGARSADGACPASADALGAGAFAADAVADVELETPGREHAASMPNTITAAPRMLQRRAIASS
jgi:hypothetical protein